MDHGFLVVLVFRPKHVAFVAALLLTWDDFRGHPHSTTGYYRQGLRLTLMKSDRDIQERCCHWDAKPLRLVLVMVSYASLTVHHALGLHPLSTRCPWASPLPPRDSQDARLTSSASETLHETQFLLPSLEHEGSPLPWLSWLFQRNFPTFLD